MPNVLVVEDEIHIQKLIKLILQKHGYVAETVSSAEDAFKYLASSLPDLIILDIMLPGMDGVSALRQLRSSERLKKIPIAMLTALAQGRVVQEGINLGVKDFIRKPFHPAELVERVGKIFTVKTSRVG